MGYSACVMKTVGHPACYNLPNYVFFLQVQAANVDLVWLSLTIKLSKYIKSEGK